MKLVEVPYQSRKLTQGMTEQSPEDLKAYLNDAWL